MLARSYKVMGRLDEAEQATPNRRRHSSNHPDLLVDFAELLAMRPSTAWRPSRKSWFVRP